MSTNVTTSKLNSNNVNQMNCVQVLTFYDQGWAETTVVSDGSPDVV